MNVLLSSPCKLLESLTERFRSDYPDMEVTGNFEQVLAMVKLGEVSRICIFMGGINCSSSKSNMISGQMAAEKIHEINPSIPIMIWGQDLEWDSESRGYVKRAPIFDNEKYMDIWDYDNDTDGFFKVIREFFNSNISYRL